MSSNSGSTGCNSVQGDHEDFTHSAQLSNHHFRADSSTEMPSRGANEQPCTENDDGSIQTPAEGQTAIMQHPTSSNSDNLTRHRPQLVQENSFTHPPSLRDEAMTRPVHPSSSSTPLYLQPWPENTQTASAPLQMPYSHVPNSHLATFAPSPPLHGMINATAPWHNMAGTIPSGAIVRHPTPMNSARISRSFQLPQSRAPSTNYRGDPNLAANYSADIPDDYNCSVWVTNLPPSCTYGQLLGSIRNCDKVFASHINPPEDSRHPMAAAKVIFFSPVGARRLLHQAAVGAFKVDNYTPRVFPNRVKTGPQQPSQRCRVLHIEGPIGVVNHQTLSNLFNSNMVYELEKEPADALFEDLGSGRRRLEYRFASFRAQAHTAAILVSAQRDQHILLPEVQSQWQHTTWTYGVDPCM